MDIDVRRAPVIPELAPCRPGGAAIITVALALASVATLQSAMGLVHDGGPLPIIGLFTGHTAYWAICALFVPSLLWLAGRFPLEPGRWRAAACVHLAASMVLAVLSTAMFYVVGTPIPTGAFAFTDVVSADFYSGLWTFLALTGVAHALVFRTHARDRDRTATLRDRELEARGGDVVEPTNPGARPRQQFAAREPGGVRLVPAHDILWIDTQGNYVRLHTRSGRALVRETMSSMEKCLDPARFVRIHRCTMVAVDQIRRIEPLGHGAYRLVLEDESSLLSSRSYASVVAALRM